MTRKKWLGWLSGIGGAALAAVVASRAPHHSAPTAPIEPSAPPSYTLTVHVCELDCAADNKIPRASVTLDHAAVGVVATPEGDASFPNLPAGRYTVCAKADGWKEFCADHGVPADGDVFLGLDRDVPPLSRVHLDGRSLRLEDGRPWNWRYATGFTILARSDAEQDAFLDWAAARTFNGIRILTTAKLLADLPPDVGRARLPALIEKLRRRGMGAEIVALADTAARGMSRAEMREHVAGVAAIVAAAPIPLTIEIANENAHPTQQKELQDVGFLRELRALVPQGVPVSLGSSCCNQPDTVENYPGGDYSTPHLDRSRPTFQEVARIKHLIEEFRSYVVDDEGIGAAEADIDGKRSARPERFFAQGVLDRLGGIGATFHFDAGLTAAVPGPQSDACARAFIEGATLVSDTDSFRYVNDSGADGITRGADWSKVFKVFGFVNRDGARPSYVVALGVTGPVNPTYVNGWHQVRIVAERPGVQVWQVAK
jgi:hypothetical protein